MTDLHEAPFKWPTGPSKVIVSGSFDDWSSSTELSKTDSGFVGTFHLPWAHKITYKYVVDGQWRVNPAEPQEPDSAGNINNVYTTPPKPVVEAKSAPPSAAVPAVVEKTKVEEAKANAASIVSYMASGLGAAFATVTGIDPVNPQQIPIEDDKTDEILAATSVSGPDARKAEPAPTIGTTHDPLVPEAPVEAKKPIDALAPIADEPVVLNLLPTTATITQSVTNAANYVTGTTKNLLPTSYLPTAITDKLPGGTPSNGIPIPDAVEPYKEPVTSEPVSVPDAVEPYKPTSNGTLPGETEAPTSKVSEAASKVSGETTIASQKASEALSKAKEVVSHKTPPTSPRKSGFPDSEASASIRSAADGTPKRKKRHSFFGKIKEALTPEKKKHKVSASTSS